MTPELLAWEAEYRRLVPVFRAALYGDNHAARMAWIKARPEPPAVVVPPPLPVWIARPPGLPADVTLGSDYPGFVVRGGEWLRAYRADGRHQKRHYGRHTKHGRLNAAACHALCDAYYDARQKADNDRWTFIRRVEEECYTEAIRGGKGWIYGALRKNGRTGYFLPVPGQRIYAFTGANSLGTLYASREDIEVVEEDRENR